MHRMSQCRDGSEGKRALIIGGASGIGLASGRAFSHEGARLVIADIDGDDARDALSAVVQDHAVVCQADVSREADVAPLFGRSTAGRRLGSWSASERL